jgi:hypothetical protein
MDLVACSICSGASLGDLGGVGGGLVVGDDGSHRECSSMSVVVLQSFVHTTDLSSFQCTLSSSTIWFM